MDDGGEKVSDPETLLRIEALVIPPAWEDVWICPTSNGHIQAVGTDGRGRRQYRYHDVWRTRRDREKFDHMLEFAGSLPDLRRTSLRMLTDTELSRERVLACAVRLLDLGFFRIGSEGYAEENQTYGLATMLKSHVSLADGAIEFDYMAKGSKQRVQSVVDPDVYSVVQALKRRRGGGNELLAWRDAKQRWVDVKSADINSFLKEHTGHEVSAKDFRTWNATVLMSVGLAVSDGITSPSGQKRAVARAYKEVAHYLGNTPAVCRKSYVDPRVVDRYRAGETIKSALDALWECEADELAVQGPIELAVLNLLDGAPPAQIAA